MFATVEDEQDLLVFEKLRQARKWAFCVQREFERGGYRARNQIRVGEQGCSTLWNGQDFKQVIDARQSSAIAVLAEGAGLV